MKFQHVSLEETRQNSFLAGIHRALSRTVVLQVAISTCAAGLMYPHYKVAAAFSTLYIVLTRCLGSDAAIIWGCFGYFSVLFVSVVKNW